MADHTEEDPFTLLAREVCADCHAEWGSGERAHHYREGYLDGTAEFDIAKEAAERQAKTDLAMLFGGFGL